MDNKLINKEIRKVSNYSSLPIAVFILLINIIVIAFAPIIRWLSSLGIYVSEDVQHFILYSVQYLVVASIAIAVFYFTRKKTTGLTFKSCFKKPAMSEGWIAKWIVIAMAFCYISNFVTLFISSILDILFGIEYVPLDLDFGGSGFATFTLVLTLSIYAPFFEELLFRGAVYRNNEIMGQKFAMIVTGVAFGLWHMNFVQLIYATVIGIFASFLYAKTRSIIPSMILHFLINTISAIINILYGIMGDPSLYENQMQYVMENLAPAMLIMILGFSVLALIITGIVLFIIELVKHRKQLALKKSVFPVSATRKIVVYFTAPVTLITFAYMIGMTIYNIL